MLRLSAGPADLRACQASSAPTGKEAAPGAANCADKWAGVGTWTGSSMCFVPAQAAPNSCYQTKLETHGDLLQPEMKHAQRTPMAQPATSERKAQGHVQQHLPVANHNS